MKLLITTIALILLAASPARSSTVFDLTGHGGWGKSFGFSQDGIGLTTSTGRRNGSSVSSNAGDWLYQSNSKGLGMYSPGNDDNMELDGKNADEVIQFVFDTAVRLVSITFGHVDRDDDFDFYFDSGAGLTAQAADVDIPSNGRYLFSSNWEGQLFGFGANGQDDNFTIKSLKVDVTAIPLPAALPLYGSGLAIIGFIGWRKRRKKDA